jgi:hypothetical protein
MGEPQDFLGCVAFGIVASCAGLAGCASNPVSQVQEIGPGVYSISYAAKSDTEAIRKAGAHCHAKGQKLSVLHEGGDYEIQFRCVAAE